jgi:hypothetical protein
MTAHSLTVRAGYQGLLLMLIYTCLDSVTYLALLGVDGRRVRPLRANQQPYPNGIP